MYFGQKSYPGIALWGGVPAETWVGNAPLLDLQAEDLPKSPLPKAAFPRNGRGRQCGKNGRNPVGKGCEGENHQEKIKIKKYYKLFPMLQKRPQEEPPP